MKTAEFIEILLRSKRSLIKLFKEVEGISCFKLSPLIEEIDNFKIKIVGDRVKIEYPNKIINIKGVFRENERKYAFILIILYTNLLNICSTNECYIQDDIQKKVTNTIKSIGFYIRKTCFFDINDLDLNISQVSTFFKNTSVSIDMYIKETYSEISEYQLEAIKDIFEAYSLFEVTEENISFFDVLLDGRVTLRLTQANTFFAICSTYSTAYCRTMSWQNQYSRKLYCLFSTPCVKIKEVENMVNLGLF